MTEGVENQLLEITYSGHIPGSFLCRIGRRVVKQFSDFLKMLCLDQLKNIDLQSSADGAIQVAVSGQEEV